MKLTLDILTQSLSVKERKELYKDYQELLFSELILAVMEKNGISVTRLAKLSGVPPTIIQLMCTGRNKDVNLNCTLGVLWAIGYTIKRVTVNGRCIPLEISIKK